MSGPAATVRPRRQRLAGLNNPGSEPFKLSRNRTQAPPAAVAASTSHTKRPARKCCPDFIEANDEGTCPHCGHVHDESNIVNEVEFTETAAGGVATQGTFVGDNQRHANTMGGTVRGLGGGMGSRELTIWKGKEEIRKLCAALHVRQATEDFANSLYRLANNLIFVQGRRIRNVAACCIYLADRKQTESTLLLMDLSEKIHVNVWVLGETYKEFLRTIIEDDPYHLPDGKMTLPQLEPLMLKYCRKLEFGEDAYRVAEDACKLLKRMKRDWMVQGRQPAGICGACIILAARMNGYRRTVREVVYVVKVADSTINHRLYEFKRTKSSHLTVDQFRKFGLQLKDDIQPPSVWRRKEKEAKKRKRAAGEEDVSADADPSSTSQRATQARKKRRTANDAVQPPSSGSRRDEDGFTIPEIPINPDATEDDAMNFENEDHLEYVAAAAASDEPQVEEAPLPVPKKRRGRPPKKREPIVVPEEDLEIEAEIEDDLMEGIRAWESVFLEFDKNENHPVLRAAGDKAQALSFEHMPDAGIPNTEDIDEEEFADDEDIMNCVNTPEEIRLKEKIWLTENEDWLRERQAKLLQMELDEASGKTKKVKKPRRRGQMGDGSVLGGKAASSPREAVQKMLEKRAKHFSSSIDYDKLKELFPEAPEAETPTGSGQGTSPAASGSSRQAAQAEVIEVQDGGDEDAEGEYDEEEYGEQEGYEEEFDDPRQYGDDGEGGFDEDDLNDDF